MVSLLAAVGRDRFVGGVWDGLGVTVKRLREWRGVKAVAGPSGVAITTRLRTTPGDEVVLDAVAAHLGSLRRADLATMARQEPPGIGLDGEARRPARRVRLNIRKAALTAQSSARWANAIIRANDDQCQLARYAQQRHIIGLRAAIATIEKRLAQPTATRSPQSRVGCAGSPDCRKAMRPKRNDLPSNGGCSICAPNWPAPRPTGTPTQCGSPRAQDAWLKLATISRLPG